MMTLDTIASISTAPGYGAIGIIRISGENAFSIAEKLFKGKNKSFASMDSHTVAYGNLVDPKNGDPVDEVLIIKMKAPRTYTTEDIVEIQCHGGTMVERKILKLVCANGARVAEPGEFTKRAFLNGRMDLSQAEAVIDIIHARANESLKASLEQLDGKLSKNIKKVRHRLIAMLAHIEAFLDYPEYEVEEISKNKIYLESLDIKQYLKTLSDSFEKGRILREGIQIVIAGRPNVGKSSLLNYLSGSDRAIVTDIPGTTRDVIEEYVELSGVPVKLIDTAGIRETEDVVENIGVEKARSYMERADLILFMIDAAAGMNPEDEKIFEKMKDKKFAVILNKMDKASDIQLQRLKAFFLQREVSEAAILEISVLEDQGLDGLEDYIRNTFLSGNISINSESLLTNVRHKHCIDEAGRSVENILSAVDAGMPHDIFTVDIKAAAEALGTITGESVHEDVVKEIFSRFCIGK